MILFIVSFLIAFGISLVSLIRRKKGIMEIWMFAIISLLGFTVWMSIYLKREINLNGWFSWLLDRWGL